MTDKIQGIRVKDFLKSESVGIKWLEDILKELEKKEKCKIVLENGYEFEPQKMSTEKRGGVDLAISFIRERLSTAKKKAGDGK